MQIAQGPLLGIWPLRICGITTAEEFLNTEVKALETCRPQAMNRRLSAYALHVRHPWLDGETERQARLSTTSSCSCMPCATRIIRNRA